MSFYHELWIYSHVTTMANYEFSQHFFVWHVPQLKELAFRMFVLFESVALCSGSKCVGSIVSFFT